MSHLRPLTVAWSSGGVGASGGQPRESAGRGARTSCSDPSTAALCTRPHSQRPQLRGGGVLRPQSRGPGAPRLSQAGLPAPLRPCCSQLAPLLCGAVVCHFLPSPGRAPAASRPAAEDAPKELPRAAGLFRIKAAVPAGQGHPASPRALPYRPHCAGTRSPAPLLQVLQKCHLLPEARWVVFQL